MERPRKVGLRTVGIAALAASLGGDQAPASAGEGGGRATGGPTRPAAVAGSPTELIVQPDDLPLPFPLAQSDEPRPGNASALYFRPDVLMADTVPAGDLLGVMANLVLLPSPLAAADSFATAAAEPDDVERDLAGKADGAVAVTPLGPAAVAGADKTSALRVAYRMQGVDVVEYRYRLLVANAVASLIVTGRAGDSGDEPAALAEQAATIAANQVRRLRSANRP